MKWCVLISRVDPPHRLFKIVFNYLILLLFCLISAIPFLKFYFELYLILFKYFFKPTFIPKPIPRALRLLSLRHSENVQIKDSNQFRYFLGFWGSWVKILGFKKMYVCMYETKFCPQHNSWTDGHNELNFRLCLRYFLI